MLKLPDIFFLLFSTSQNTLSKLALGIRIKLHVGKPMERGFVQDLFKPKDLVSALEAYSCIYWENVERGKHIAALSAYNHGGKQFANI